MNAFWQAQAVAQQWDCVGHDPKSYEEQAKWWREAAKEQLEDRTRIYG